MTSGQENMVQELIDNEGGSLSGKEMDFIEQLYNDGEYYSYELSQKQEDWLNAIYDREFQ